MTGTSNWKGNARTREGPGRFRLAVLLGPALAVTLILFGGGLLLGGLQALGHLPAAGLDRLTLAHFQRVVTDPDFLKSMGLTVYISATSTLAAAAVSVALAMALTRLADTYRVLHFVLQIPLTVPHLVVAVSMVFLLSPAGIISRLSAAAGIVDSPADFPLLVNDRWSVGIILAYVWKEIPFITLMVLAVLKQSGTELIDVGRTLKAGPWQRFRYITLPTIFPSLGAACLIVFAFTFGAFEVPFLMGQTFPMTLPVWAYKNYSDIDLMARPEGIAIGLIIAVVAVSAVVLSQVLIQFARKRGVVL
jgi:putative spermidine/putrescine transport system permease protein